MATLRKKDRGTKAYYYLAHTLRNKGKIEKKELYLGKSIPKNVEELKQRFLARVYKERWHPLLENIKETFGKELKNTPQSAIKEELRKFVIRFTYDTQRIEGSTLTLRETAQLLEGGITPAGKPLRDVKEAEAHKLIFEEAIKKKSDLSPSNVLHWHRKLFEATKLDIAGKIRSHQVAIAGSKFMPPFPAELYPLLREFFMWYEKHKSKMQPVELAALVHLKLVTIHPFADGNGRISRLMMNVVLYLKGYPMLNVPYEGRNSYYHALERAQTKKNETIFMQWFFKRYIKEYRRYITKK